MTCTASPLTLMDLRDAGIAESTERMLQGPSRDRSEVPPGSRRWAWRAGLGTLVLLVVIGLGPRASVEERWAAFGAAGSIEDRLARAEESVSGLRPGESKAIAWADPSSPGRTPISLVYLHGFSADRHEVDPLVGDVARAIGANVYYARLAGHGQDGQALGRATAEEWLDDAAHAVEIGARIGNAVVLMGTSTGATLALWAGSHPRAPGALEALILISPNLGLRDRTSEVLLWPWGALAARALLGEERCFEPKNEAQRLHWTTCYPPRALVEMMSLVDFVRYRDLTSLSAPALVIYSRDDRVVDPSATERMLARLGERGRSYVIDDSDDPEHHVLAGDIMSPGTTDGVRERILAFLAEIPALRIASSRPEAASTPERARQVR
jgi:alpha-beta hydrolase superfamily lysophospholipase